MIWTSQKGIWSWFTSLGWCLFDHLNGWAYSISWEWLSRFLGATWCWFRWPHAIAPSSRNSFWAKTVPSNRSQGKTCRSRDRIQWCVGRSCWSTRPRIVFCRDQDGSSCSQCVWSTTWCWPDFLLSPYLSFIWDWIWRTRPWSRYKVVLARCYSCFGHLLWGSQAVTRPQDAHRSCWSWTILLFGSRVVRKAIVRQLPFQ